MILSRAAQHEELLATPPAKLPATARQAVLRSLIAKGLLEEVPAPCEALALGWRQEGDGAWIALRITAAGMAAIGNRADVGDDTPKLQETAIVPTAPQGGSPAALAPPPPSPGGEAPDGAQRPPVARHGGIRRVDAITTAAAAILTTWDAPAQAGLAEAVMALRETLVAAPRPPRAGTKQEAVLTLLRRDDGTTIAEIIEATGWQPHTVRGFLAGLKRRGITVEVLERVRQVGPDRQGAKGSYSIYRIAAAGSTSPTDATALAEAG